MKLIQSILLTLFLYYAIFTNISWAAHTNPNVLVSITPFYALVAAIMQGVGTPQLLVKPGSSPHEYTLRPSDMQRLINADLIFWEGPVLETFLVKPFSNLRKTQMTVEFDQTPGLLLLPLRHSAAWDPDEDEHDSNQDMHFWLDPNNAMLLTDVIVDKLIHIDPNHANIYKKNGHTLKQRLKKLDGDIAAELKNVKTIPYIVFHDAYQYFERRYGLNGDKGVKSSRRL